MNLAQVIMQFSPALVTPLLETANFNIPVTFTGLTQINSVNGTYTPANDSPVIHLFTAGDQPNWMLIVSDAQLNINLINGLANIINQLPVSKVAFLTSLAPTVTNYTALQFYGAIASNLVAPMAQAVPVNYAIYWGNGIVS
jgi:hypothetical protein